MTHHTTPAVSVEGDWFKSSYSSETGGNCVEVANLTSTGQIGIRDSKDPEGPTLLLVPEQFAAFIAEVRAGRYDI